MQFYDVTEDYANLLNTEYQWCLRNETAILKKAKAVYKIGCNKNHTLNNMCCDFKKLEKEYLQYKNN